MATNKSTTEEVIEKKDSSPVTVSCLILSVVAILGALTFQILEIAEYREGFSESLASAPNPADSIVSKDAERFKRDVQALLDDNIVELPEGEGELDPMDEEVEEPEDETEEESDE